MLQARLTLLVLSTLESLPKGRLELLLPDGEVRVFGQSPELLDVKLVVKDKRFFKALAWSGDIGLAESYLAGYWDCESPEGQPNPAPLIHWFLLNHEFLPANKRVSRGVGALKQGIERLRHALRRNTLKGSRKNILAHYDLGNEFYAEFLDPSMTYSSAYFPDASATLAEAQTEKYDRLCRKLALKPDMRVLEIGCGWGGFAEHAVCHYGCHVTGLTLSPAQLGYAWKRLARCDQATRVEFLLKDYREMDGQFDAIVSIEMLEAVGHDYLPDFFRQCDRLLAPDGLIALQVITCPDSTYNSYRHSMDFIRKHIFPGGHLPSLGALQQACVAAETRFDWCHLESFGGHYARTLQLWRLRFDAAWERIEPLGFDERFRRLWRMYLAYCEAAFTMRHINVVQAVLARRNEQGMMSERSS